jgi:hypothetical protein
MKQLMYFSFATLCFSLALLIGFHLGSRQAQAQGTGVVAAMENAAGNGGNFWVVTDGGDVYLVDPCCPFSSTWSGNVLNGAATNATPTTWGSLKQKYVEEN